jgi:hypothetical protein
MPGLNVLLRPHQLIGVAWYVVRPIIDVYDIENTSDDIGWPNKRSSQSMVGFWQMMYVSEFAESCIEHSPYLHPVEDGSRQNCAHFSVS